MKIEPNAEERRTESARDVGSAEGRAPKPLSAAARRALAEAAERRKAAAQAAPVEVNGRDGLDPVRYGDWEIKGLASDF